MYQLVTKLKIAYFQCFETGLWREGIGEGLGGVFKLYFILFQKMSRFAI